MPVDKFWRNSDRATPVYTGIRRDGGKIAIGTIEMNSHIIKNVAEPLANQDVASKNCVDANAFTTAGGVVSGGINKCWFWLG